jgi:hypothetical protein
MIQSYHSNNPYLLLLVAGVKGAVASTLAVALAAMQSDAASVLPSLTTGNKFARLGPLPSTRLTGWDTSDDSLTASVKLHGVVPDVIWQSHAEFLDEAVKQGVPLAGRDGKTGQTYFKVVLASALKAWNTCVRFLKRRDWR